MLIRFFYIQIFSNINFIYKERCGFGFNYKKVIGYPIKRIKKNYCVIMKYSDDFECKYCGTETYNMDKKNTTLYISNLNYEQCYGCKSYYSYLKKKKIGEKITEEKIIFFFLLLWLGAPFISFVLAYIYENIPYATYTNIYS